MLPIVLMLALAAGDRGHAEEAAVRWRDRDVAPAELPAELGTSAKEAALAWAPFAAEHGYRMYLEDQGRVLLLVPGKKAARKDLDLIDKTCALFDKIAPAPADAAASPANAPRQDGEGGPAGDGEGTSDEEGWSYSYSWGSGEWSRDAATAVLVEAKNEDDYSAALDFLAGSHEYLKGWIAAARKLAGCSLENPLVSVWLLEGEGLEEWNPENELVHRLTTELTLRRFGRQPAWLLQGLAWYVEHDIQGTHYCFPWRNEFVYATEHTGWEAALKTAFKGQTELRAEQVTGLSRGSFQIEQAQNAWGAATFLARHHPEALPAILEDLRVVMEEKGKVTHEDGTWELIPDWTPPPAEQLAILKQRAGDDVLDQLLAFYKQGKAYRPEGK
jgi:hypothetical protein